MKCGTILVTTPITENAALAEKFVDFELGA